MSFIIRSIHLLAGCRCPKFVMFRTREYLVYLSLAVSLYVSDLHNPAQQNEGVMLVVFRMPDPA